MYQEKMHTLHRPIPNFAWLLLIIYLIIPSIALPNILYVPEEYETIELAVTRAINGDTVLVAEGTYTGLCYRGNNFSPQDITLMGSGWPHGTVITGCPAAPENDAFYITDVVGWRFTNFEVMDCGDAFGADRIAKCVYDHNWMHNTYMAYWSCGVEMGSICATQFHHNLLTDIDFVGFMIWCNDSTFGVHIYNNTIVGVWGYEGIQFRYGSPYNSIVTNNIIMNCGGQGVEFAMCNQHDNQISYNCIYETDGPFENVPHPGPGNIFESPRFTLENSIPEYYFLSQNSPCIDTGNPNHFYDDPDSSRSDIGAFPWGTVIVQLRILWVRGFPGDTVDVPITVSDVSALSVNSCEFVITYPNDDLQFLNMTLPDSSLPFQAGWQIFYNGQNGVIAGNMEGANSITGTGVMAAMRFVLSESALPDSVWNIRFQSAFLNHGALDPRTINGGICLPSGLLFGDVNLNGQVTIADAALLFDYLMGSAQLTEIQQYVAEVSNQSGITSYDGALITQHCAGLFQRFPVEGGFVESHAEGQFTIPVVTAQPGQEVEVVIQIHNAINVASAQMDMTIGGIPVEFVNMEGPGLSSWFSRYGGEYPNHHLFLGGAEAVQSNRDFCTLTFQVPDSVEGMFSIQLSNLMINETMLSGQVYQEIPIGSASVSNNQTNLPTEFAFNPPYPNPFNATLTIPYEVPMNSKVRISIYNLLGQHIATLIDHSMSPGSYSVVWNAGNLPSGNYFCRMEASNYSYIRKLLLLK
jgi:hypothetical protein